MKKSLWLIGGENKIWLCVTLIFQSKREIPCSPGCPTSASVPTYITHTTKEGRDTQPLLSCFCPIHLHNNSVQFFIPRFFFFDFKTSKMCSIEKNLFFVNWCWQILITQIEVSTQNKQKVENSLSIFWVAHSFYEHLLWKKKFVHHSH